MQFAHISIFIYDIAGWPKFWHLKHLFFTIFYISHSSIIKFFLATSSKLFSKSKIVIFLYVKQSSIDLYLFVLPNLLNYWTFVIFNSLFSSFILFFIDSLIVLLILFTTTLNQTWCTFTKYIILVNNSVWE